jgi:carbon starvation protein CstA
MQKFLNFFAVIVVLLIMAFFAMVIFTIQAASPTAQNVMLTLVGTLAGAFMTIVGFYFGSSKSSSEKNDVIGKMLNNTSTGPGEPDPTKSL